MVPGTVAMKLHTVGCTLQNRQGRFTIFAVVSVCGGLFASVFAQLLARLNVSEYDVNNSPLRTLPPRRPGVHQGIPVMFRTPMPLLCDD